MDPLDQLPPRLSTLAPHVDPLFLFLFWASTAFFVVITGLVVYFAWRYRREANPKAAPTGHNQVLEIGWTFAPLIVLVYLFHAGFQGYVFSATVPDDAITVRVHARQWAWEFEYPGGARIDKLYVPAGQPVRLVMSSADVIHSFYVPDFRVKKDVVPGMYTTLWFEAPEPSPVVAGSQPDDYGLPVREGSVIYCTEFCGTQHSGMLSRVIVVPPDEYQRRLEAASGPPPGKTPAEWGEMLYTAKGCGACHSVDGSARPGPTWQRMWGERREFADGTTLDAVDENYIREAILRPNARIRRGFESVVMPPYAGSLRDAEIDALIEYIKTLR